MSQIFLIGMMGCGKTTIARLLSEFLGINFADIDEEVEKKAGKEINRIFHEDGEEYFRDLEEKTLCEIASIPGDLIVSCGGGVILREKNRNLLKSKNTFYIEVPIEVLENRISKSSKRPLLTCSNPSRNLPAGRQIRKIFEDRKSIYNEFEKFKENPELSALQNLPFFIYKIKDILDSGIFNSAAGSLEDKSITISPGELFDELAKENSFCISSQNINELYKSLFPEEIFYTFPDGEKAKDISEITAFWEKLLTEKVTRNTTFNIIGGGSLSDSAGFGLSTFKRGLEYSIFPTTLLSQVDASIGGKTAINFSGIKNQIGTFSFAKKVFIDPVILLSAPEETLFDGIVEGLKVALTVSKDAVYIDSQLKKAKRIKAIPDLSTISDFIKNAVKDKLEIVSKDPLEKNIRKVLNLGHTFGHLYESTYGYSHGKSVAMGIIKILEKNTDDSIKKVLAFFIENLKREEIEKIYLPLNPDMRLKLKNDKKNENEKIMIISLEKPGEPISYEFDIG